MKGRWRRVISNKVIEYFDKGIHRLFPVHCTRQWRGIVIFFVRLGIFGILLTGVVACSHQKAIEYQTSTNQDTAAESAFQMNRKYPYANDRMVYIPLENGELEQWSVEGVYQQKIRLSIEDSQNEGDQGKENGKDNWDEYDENEGSEDENNRDQGNENGKDNWDEYDENEGSEDENNRDQGNENGKDGWDENNGNEDEEDDWDESDLLWVDNEELIWSVTREGEGDEEYIDYDHVYSTPIERKDGKEVLLAEQTKELFVCDEDSGIGGAGLDGVGYKPGVYVDDAYIIYQSAYEGLLAYNRKQGGKPVQLTDAEENQFHAQMWSDLSSQISGDRIVCHSGIEDGKIKDDLYGFWNYSLSDQQAQKIDGRCFNWAAYVADPVRNKVYYQIADDQSVWEYDIQTGECQELIAEQQFQTCFRQNQLFWDDAYYNDSLYVEGDQIYLVKNRDHPQIFSYTIGEGDLVYEKQLTSVIHSSQYSDGWENGTDHDYWGGVVIDRFLMIAEGKLLLYWQTSDEEDTYFLCVDLETAEQKIITRKDPEKIYFGMNGLWIEPGTTGKWRPSEEQKENDAGQQVLESSPGKQSESADPLGSPLSIADQLQCISQHADLWMQKEYEDDLMQYYAVTDLDHNGRLELIATSGPQGSGCFTFTHYYQVSADGRDFRPITDAIGDIDILNGIKTAYVDSETDTYYYLASDYVSGGAGARYCWLGAIVLDSGMLTSRTYAETGSDWDEKKKEETWYAYSYLGGKKKKIKYQNFYSQKVAAQFFKGFEKKSVKISWFHLPGKKKRTQQKILEKVTASYQKFSVK